MNELTIYSCNMSCCYSVAHTQNWPCHSPFLCILYYSKYTLLFKVYTESVLTAVTSWIIHIILNGNDCICTVKCAWEGRGVILRPHLNLEFFPLSCGVLFTMGGGGGDGGVAVWEQLVCDPPTWPVCCCGRWQLLRSRSPRQRCLPWSRSSWRWFGLSCGVWGGVVRYVHRDHRQMQSSVPAVVSFTSQRKHTPRFVFLLCPGVRGW